MGFVVKLVVSIIYNEQEDFNVLLDGKIVNVICIFFGKGVFVWGVYMLDGNSGEWCYISVWCMIIFIE